MCFKRSPCHFKTRLSVISIQNYQTRYYHEIDWGISTFSQVFYTASGKFLSSLLHVTTWSKLTDFNDVLRWNSTSHLFTLRYYKVSPNTRILAERIFKLSFFPLTKFEEFFSYSYLPQCFPNSEILPNCTLADEGTFCNSGQLATS